MLTPADIHDQEFTRSFRGYDEDEVDDFLDKVIGDYEQLFKENADLTEQNAQGSKDLEKYQQIEKSLHDTLILAQSKADEVVSKAQQEAAALLASAHEEVKTLQEAARQKCDALRQQAEQDAQRELERNQEQLTETQLKYEAIVKKQRQFLTKIKSLLRTELDLLDEDGVQQIVGDLTSEMELDFAAPHPAETGEQPETLETAGPLLGSASVQDAAAPDGEEAVSLAAEPEAVGNVEAEKTGIKQD